jgi:hypothetical protein
MSIHIVNGHNLTQLDTDRHRNTETAPQSPQSLSVSIRLYASLVVAAEQPVAAHKFQAIFAMTVDAWAYYDIGKGLWFLSAFLLSHI